MMTDSPESPESGDSFRICLVSASLVSTCPSETLMMSFPSIDDSRLLVLEARVEFTAYRELSSYVYLLFFFRAFIGRTRDLIQGIAVVMMTRYVSMKSQRS